MKKIIASALAAAMALSLSSVAFAWGNSGSTGGTTVGGTTITPSGPKVTSRDTVVIPFNVNSDETAISSVYKGEIDISGASGFPLYTYGPEDNVTLNIVAATTDNAARAISSGYSKTNRAKIVNISARSNSQVTASVKRNDGYGWKTDGTDVSPTTLKLKAITKGNDFKYDDDLNDVEIDLDVTIQAIDEKNGTMGSKWDTTVTLKYDAGVAYSKTQELLNDEDVTLSKANGTIVKFSDVIYDKTRVRAGDNIDVYFKGNYGTNKQNLRVVTDPIDAITTFFEDTNVNVYQFAFNPKFASSVKVAIDADPNATVYSYNEKTGDITKINTAYENNQATFETKNLNCFVVSDDEYENGNVKGEGDVEVDEPVDEPTVDEEETVTPSEPNDKPNPGTGANDMVGAAAAMAVVSLIAAGAVAFKRASK